MQNDVIAVSALVSDNLHGVYGAIPNIYISAAGLMHEAVYTTKTGDHYRFFKGIPYPMIREV